MMAVVLALAGDDAARVRLAWRAAEQALEALSVAPDGPARPRGPHSIGSRSRLTTTVTEGSTKRRAADSCAAMGKGLIDVAWDMETGDPDDFTTLLLLLGHPQVNLIGVTIAPGTPDQVGVVRAEHRGRR
jgi:hypothetical protein